MLINPKKFNLISLLCIFSIVILNNLILNMEKESNNKNKYEKS